MYGRRLLTLHSEHERLAVGALTRVAVDSHRFEEFVIVDLSAF